MTYHKHWMGREELESRLFPFEEVASGLMGQDFRDTIHQALTILAVGIRDVQVGVYWEHFSGVF